MIAERRKLARLLRLERVRAIAKASAASEAARAETTLANLQALAARSRNLAADYTGRSDAGNGAELRRLGVFAAGLHGVCRNTETDARRAQAAADLRQGELANAERRRAAVEDRAAAASREIDARAQTPILSGRRKPRA
jgi:trehalose-6-phosphatase